MAFVANISHEIRTPLNVILGYNELIAEQLADAGIPDLASYLEAVQRAGCRLLRTVEEILDFSKIEAGALELDPVEIDLGSCLQALVNEFRVLAESKGLELICELEAPQALIRFDQHCLASALANLLQNAIKFTERGIVVARLFRSATGNLKVEIRDSGVGIDESFMPRLFEPFAQEDSSYSRRFEGTGLGLVLTRKYLELNGAALHISSAKNAGTVCTIDFRSEGLAEVGLMSRGAVETARSGPTTDAPSAAHHVPNVLSFARLDRR
jgi:signal transduction histidine kinase